MKFPFVGTPDAEKEFLSVDADYENAGVTYFIFWVDRKSV